MSNDYWKKLKAKLDIAFMAGKLKPHGDTRYFVSDEAALATLSVYDAHHMESWLVVENGFIDYAILQMLANTNVSKGYAHAKPFGIDICHSELRECLREPDGEWDNGDWRTEHQIEAASLPENPEIPFLPLPFQPQAGQRIYVVYVVYSTGDSFTHDQCGGIEFVDAFSDLTKANILRLLLEQNAEANATKIKYRNEIGQKMLHDTSIWKGYFENFEYAKIVTLEVQPSKE